MIRKEDNCNGMMKKVKENCLKIFLVSIALFIILLGIVYVYLTRVQAYSEKEQTLVSVSYAVNPIEVENGSTLTQSFKISQEMKYFKIKFGVDLENIVDDVVYVELHDANTDKLIKVWRVSAGEINNEEAYRFDVGSVQQELTGNYILKLKFEGKERISSIQVFRTEINQYNNGELVINDEKCIGDLAFSAYGADNKFLYKMFFELLIWLMGGGLLIYFLLWRTSVSVEIIAMILVLLLGFSHMQVMPTYSTPDERGHFATTYYFSNILLGKEAVDAEGNVLVRNEDLLLNVENIRPNLGTYALMYENMLDKSKDDTVVSYDRGPLSVPFWSYFPQILGISIARLLDAGNIMLLFSGAFSALLFFAFCVYISVKLMPFGKVAMIIMSLLPMTLETAGSYSYDVVVNGLSYVFIAYVFWLAYEKKKATFKDWSILLGIIMLMAPIKVVYVLIAGMCLIIPGNKNKLYSLAIFVGGALSILVVRLSTVSYMVTTYAGDSSTITELNNQYTIPYIIHNISRTIGVLYNTLREMTDAILEPLVGHRLGYWDIVIPWHIVFCFVILLLLATIEGEKERVYIKNTHKLLILFLCIVMTGGITLALMLDFTQISDNVVRGIQGRYFTPFLPLIIYTLRTDKICIRKNLDKQLIFGSYMLNYFILWRIFETTVAR